MRLAPAIKFTAVNGAIGTRRTAATAMTPCLTYVGELD
jgi:hypothetical protein